MTLAAKRYVIGKLYNLEIANLSPDSAQPRKHIDEQALAELKASIEKHGVLQPVLVRLEQGKFLLVSGERRYLASLAAGLPTIPAIVTNGDPAEISLVENLLREDFTAIEEAEAVERLRTSHNYQLSDLSGVLGKSPSTISEILSLNKLPDTIKDECRNDPKAARTVLAEIAKQRTWKKCERSI
jgi:ParB family transcriptional regulator, chromosome partitioning protein